MADCSLRFKDSGISGFSDSDYRTRRRRTHGSSCYLRKAALQCVMDDRERRVQMVEHQIAARGVRDPRVLAAVREVPRHLFVPADQRTHAYEDRALPIASGQTISQPYIVAVMTELLAVEPHHRILEIGTGSGYQTAILAQLSRNVISIERHPELAKAAAQAFATAGLVNVDIRVGDGSEGLPEEAPFDRILVTAGAPAIPESLKQQLADRGRLVIPVGPSGYQHLTVINRFGNDFEQQEREACVFVPLIGRHGWRG